MAAPMTLLEALTDSHRKGERYKRITDRNEPATDTQRHLAYWEWRNAVELVQRLLSEG